MMTIKFIKKLIVYIFINIFAIFLWFRYVEEHLPQHLPFNLNGVGFISILITCIIYLYLICKLLFNREDLKIYYKYISGFFLKLLYILRDLTPNIYFIIKEGISFLLKFDHKLPFTFIYVYLYAMPRILFLLVFLYDVFYLKILTYTYKMLWITIFPLLINIILLLLKYRLKENTILLDAQAEFHCVLVIKDIEEYSYQVLSAQELTLEQTGRLILKLPLMHYDPTFRIDFVENERKKGNIPRNAKIDIKAFIKNIRKALNYSISLNLILVQYIQIQHRYKKILNLSIFVLYLITWAYILVISFHTLDIKTLAEILSWLPINHNNPFI